MTRRAWLSSVDTPLCDGVTVIDGPNDELLDAWRLAVPRDKAIAISGLSARQVDYWARTGLVDPAVDTRVSPVVVSGFMTSWISWR